MNDKANKDASKETANDVNDWKVIKLGKPIEYQGTEVREINLSKMDDLTAQDMNGTYDLYYTLGGNRQIMQESTLLFAQILAHKVTGYPMEVFERMNIRDAMRLKNRVYRFFFLEE